MFNENDFSRRLPQGKLRSMVSLKVLLKLLLAAPEKDSALVGKYSPIKKLACAGVFASFLFLAVGAWAYSSPRVTSGDALFAVKTFGEKVAVAVAPEVDKAEAWAKIADRRLAEFNHLAGNDALVGFDLVNSANASEEDSLTKREKKAFSTLELMKEAFDKGLNSVASIADPVKAEKATALLEKVAARRRLSLEVSLSSSTQPLLASPKSSQGYAFGQEMAERIAVAMDESDSRSEVVRKMREEVRQAVLEKREMKKEIIASSTRILREKELAKDEAVVALMDAREDVIAWKEAVLEKVPNPTPAMEKIFDRVDDRLAKAEKALLDGKTSQVQGLLQSVLALQNNAKHFLKEAAMRERLDKAQETMRKNRELMAKTKAMSVGTSSTTLESIRNFDKYLQNENIPTSTKARFQERVRAIELMMMPTQSSERRVERRLRVKDIQPAPEIRVEQTR